MIGLNSRNLLFGTVGCLLLAGCGAAQPSTANGGIANSGASPAAPVAANSATTPTAAATGSGLTACGLITAQEASTAIGSAAGPGTVGGTAALSECIYGDGALIVSMKTDSKALYDKTRNAARARGATDVPGVGDDAFEAGTDHVSTLLFLKGTTLVSIIFSGPGAQDAAVAVAKIASGKL